MALIANATILACVRCCGRFFTRGNGNDASRPSQMLQIPEKPGERHGSVARAHVHMQHT